VSERGAKLLDEAMSLPVAERAELADRLRCSLDHAYFDQIDAWWRKEVEARIDAFERGEVEAIPADQAIAEALQRARR
jgi:putative addiction module component (TIGR02574 family)